MGYLQGTFTPYVYAHVGRTNDMQRTALRTAVDAHRYLATSFRVRLSSRIKVKKTKRLGQQG